MCDVLLLYIVHSLLSTHADRQGVHGYIGRLLFVCFCTVKDFSAEDKAIAASNFAWPVIGVPQAGITHFSELCYSKSPKSDESASARATPTRMYIYRIEMRRRINVTL